VKTTSLPTVLEGVTRDAVLTMLRDMQIPCREERFTRDEVYLADEAFFTGTAAEVTPVREVDDRRVGTGEPGPVTRRLQERFFAAVQGKDSQRQSWLAYV
jgi:branched-chain amino acid aminotransferase